MQKLFAASDIAVPQPPARTRNRLELPDKFKWNLDDIFTNWDDWAAAYERLEQGVERYAAFKGTLSQGPARLLEAFKLSEELGQLAYRVWYFPSLRYDEDQRDNTINARRQQVQLLFARWKQAESWFNPELLQIPLETVRGWMESLESLRLYKFAVEDLYRQQ
jgi:oligoendopeptidase F